MYIKELLYVIALKDEKNISAAARKLGISQPTLSEFLSNLENELGTDLFYREKRKLELTPSGKIYIDAAQRIMQIRDRTYSSIHKLRNPTKSTIRIAASPLRGSAKFASIFPKFSRRYPDIELQLTEAYTAQIPDMLTSEAIDLALGTFSDTDSKDFDFITCSYEEIVLAIPSYLKNSEKFTEPVAIESVKDTPFVLMNKGATIREISDEIFSSSNIQPLIIYESPNNLVVSNIISEGGGIGFLPRSLSNRFLTNISLRSLSPKYYMNNGIIYKKRKKLSEAERYFAYLSIMEDRNAGSGLSVSGDSKTSEIIIEFGGSQRENTGFSL